MKRLLCISMLLCLLCGCHKSPVQLPNTDKPELPSAVPTTAPEITKQEPTQVEHASTETYATLPATQFDPDAFVSEMTVEELVGQLFLARCPTDHTAVEDIQNYHLGGYILFGRDFENRSADTVRTTIADYQNTVKIPLLIAVDEEGGTVCRVSSQPAFRDSRFPSPRKLYDKGGLDLVLETEAEKCQLLRSVGIM